MKRLTLIFLALWLCLPSFAQHTPDTLSAGKADSLALNDSVRNPDLLIEQIRKDLEESRLEQMNLLMEIEQMKMANVVADSIKLAQQRSAIDSLRSITTGMAVVVNGDTLFHIYTNRGGLTPQQRAVQTAARIESTGKRYGVRPDSVFILSEEFTSDIMYENEVILSLTAKDALWIGMTRDELAEYYQAIIIDTLHELKDQYGLMRLLRRILLFVLLIAAQAGLIWLTNSGYKKLRLKLERSKHRFLKPLYIKDYEFLSTAREEKIMFFLLNILRWFVIIIQLLITIPILFSIFPQTEDLARTLFSYILIPVKSMGRSIIDYIPNIFSIVVIWLVIKYVIKGVGYLAGEIENERLRISGFYPDWAQPTFSIFRFLMYAFMIALIYPLLPGSDSMVFQGISVFVGLIVSLGSSTAIGNLVSGIIITYMRPFKIGDRIKIQDIIGNVIEKTPIVTRIRTLKNEIITIPNSMIMNSQTTNLSESARTIGLIIHLDTTVGYETPWRQVHELLVEAAVKTDGVIKKPHPFVLETSFDDFYITYQINAYIEDADRLSAITTALRQNIQDIFKEAGLSIMSPHFYAKYEK